MFSPVESQVIFLSKETPIVSVEMYFNGVVFCLVAELTNHEDFTLTIKSRVALK